MLLSNDLVVHLKPRLYCILTTLQLKKIQKIDYNGELYFKKNSKHMQINSWYNIYFNILCFLEPFYIYRNIENTVQSTIYHTPTFIIKSLY